MNGRASLRPLLFLTLLTCPSLLWAFDKEYCEFGTNDYSLEWAYEPTTQKIVFVLNLNTTEEEFWTGVGFSKTQGPIDFVGVLVRSGQVVMADAYLNSSGVLYTDVEGNIQTIGHDYNGKRLIVKFARPLKAADQQNDQSLDGCTTFLMPREPGRIEAHGIRPKMNDFHRFKVCDIKAHCSIDMSEHLPEKTKPSKRPPTSEDKPVQFAKSVDTSGTGDPCSFAGKDYTVNWTYAKQTDRIHFTMELPVKEERWWSAVGIGEWMADMDIGVLFLENGKVKKIGDYLSTSYGVPDEDAQNDWKLEGSSKSGKTAKIKFSRAVSTDDKKNDRPMDGCVFFQFGANSGRYEDGFSIQKHEDWPDLYKACDLRENCAELSFEKRAKNRKNKHNHKNEEETTPATDENNDEKEKAEEAKPAQSPESNEPAPTTSEPKSEERAETTPEATTASSNDDEKKEEATSQATTSEPAEISEEMAASGEEPPSSADGQKSTPAAEPTTGSSNSADISLDDSSGQEPTASNETDASVEKVATSAAPESTTPPHVEEEATTAKVPEATTTQKEEEMKTTAEATTEKSVETAKPDVSQEAKPESGKSGSCDAQKQDLAVCQSYMDNYMAQVREWAARHEETMEAQYGKACALLSAVPHVPTLCCHAFNQICASQVSN